MAEGRGSIPRPVRLIYRFVPKPWHDDYDYWRGLARHWLTSATIVNVEHDMEYRDELAHDLLACPHPLCSHAYQMYVPRNYYAHSHSAEGIGGYWITKGEEWAEYSAIGFCKITPEVRTGPLDLAPWRAVEQSVNRATTGRWHIHWPEIDHDHKR